MSKALIFSDLHIHNHKDRVDRLENCIEVLNWIFEQAKENQCEYIFFLGDLFHERSKIDVRNYLKTFEVFINHMIKTSFGINMYLLVGNHDMYHKESWEINSIKPLSAIPNIHIIESPQQISLCGRKIDWMPHTDNPVKELKSLKEKNNGAGDILFGHMSVHGALLNLSYGTKSDVIVEYDNDMVPVDASVFEDWTMTFLGHYHGAQNINSKVEYVGSPFELTFGEAFQDKHIVILDLDTLDKKYIKNDFSPKHLIVTPNDIEHENYKLDGNFVRITIEDMPTKDLIDLKRKVLLENKSILSLDTKKKERKIEVDQMAMDGLKINMLNIEQMLEKYITDKGVPEGLVKSKLLDIGKKCLQGNI